jgi:uncharacterized membrane protein YeaQ/YmgE (transglycosylase-associated protein family)
MKEGKNRTIGDEKMEEKDKIEEIESKLGDIHYNQGLIMGLTLGILGNLCVSFLIETIHAFGTVLFNTWLVVFVVSLIMTVVVYLLLVRRIVKRFLEIITTIFPSVKLKQKHPH